jgi:hypothetical protein
VDHVLEREVTTALPAGVDVAWHGVNDEDNLCEFLGSTVPWAECDVRRDRDHRLVVRHDSLSISPLAPGETLLALSTVLDAVARDGRAVKLDLKEGSPIIGAVLAEVAERGFDDRRLWFNGRMEVLGPDGFGRLRARHPAAVVQCPVDFLSPVVAAEPRRARRFLRMLTAWGVNRFSVAWDEDYYSRRLVDRLQGWGYEVNLYAVPDLGSLRRAVLVRPASLTADFNFPEWGLYGRGSGAGRRYHRAR